MENLSDLQSLDLTLPSPAYIAGAIIFGIIGIVAYRYGRKMARQPVKWLGIALMLYPYVIYETWQLYLMGTALCVAIYYYRK